MRKTQLITTMLTIALTLTACGEEETPETTQEVTLPAHCATDVAPAQEGSATNMLNGDGTMFVSVEDVFAAYDAGQSFYFLDARPPSDYKLHHIKGAFSMPFYDVEECYPAIPKDAWVVSYCACPHNESEHAARVLMDQGYTNVRVLDEGYIEWRSRGYPTSDNP